MTATPEQRSQAADPTTPGATLAALAAEFPELQEVIALNPATYQGLLGWLREYGGPEVQAALEARDRGTVVAPPPPPPPTAPPVAPAQPEAPAPPVAPATSSATPAAVAPRRFVEPSRSVPISWLNHDLRYAMALVGVGLAGLFAVVIVPAALGAISDAIYRDSYNSFFDYQAADVQFGFASFVFGILPSILMVAAVIMLPARPQATFVAAMLAAAPIVLQLLTLVASLTELWGLRIVLDFIGLLVPATAVAAWMVARMRPRAAFGLLPIALLPILLSFLSGFGFGLGFSGLGYGYGYGFGFSPIYLLLQLIGIGILVGIAWLARLVAQRRAIGPTPAERAAAFEAQQHAARVEHLRQWEAAYSTAHGGEKPPPGTIPPLNTYGSSAVAAPTGATNTMAILALVFGIGGGWLGILFGHMALSQIRRTGEQGRGLALAGLICGYIGAGITLIVIIVLIVVSVNTRSYYYY